MGDSPKWVKSKKGKKKKKRKKRTMAITMAKLRLAHASTHGARKPTGPKKIRPMYAFTLEESYPNLMDDTFIAIFHNKNNSSPIVYKLQSPIFANIQNHNMYSPLCTSAFLFPRLLILLQSIYGCGVNNNDRSPQNP